MISCNKSSVGADTFSVEIVKLSPWVLDGMPAVLLERTEILSCISQDEPRDAPETSLRRFASLCACDVAI